MTTLYRVYDHRDRLLYVGITTDLPRRIREHQAAPWFPAAARLATATIREDRDAEGLERRVIAREQPLWNVQGNGEVRGREARERRSEATRAALEQPGLWDADPRRVRNLLSTLEGGG